MKREIKFRGLRSDGKGWVYGQLSYGFNNKKATCIMPNNYFATKDLGEVDENENTVISDEMALGGFIPVIPETLGQYTGLFDRCGNKVFEGDIVEVNGTDNVGVYCTEVTHIGLGFKLKENNTDVEDDISFVSIISVIGNIHEDKEEVKNNNNHKD